MLTDGFNYSNPDFTPMAGSPLLTGASFENPKIATPDFIPTTYRRAVGPSGEDANWGTSHDSNANLLVKTLKTFSLAALMILEFIELLPISYGCYLVNKISLLLCSYTPHISGKVLKCCSSIGLSLPLFWWFNYFTSCFNGFVKSFIDVRNINVHNQWNRWELV